MLESALQQRIPQARLVPTRVGEVTLQLLQADFPRAPLEAAVARAVWDNPPYWAFCWPGGGWISQWLPQQVNPGTVVDLGCGSGVLAIALARAGWQVWAVDNDAEARQATAYNAQLNQVSFPIVSSLNEVKATVDLLVLADFLYDPVNLQQLQDLFDLYPDVLIADCRLQQVPEGFASLGQYKFRIIPDLDWGDEFNQILVARKQN